MSKRSGTPSKNTTSDSSPTVSLNPTGRHEIFGNRHLKGLLLFTALVYLPSLFGGFIWDDKTYVTESPIIKSSDGLWKIWFTKEPVDFWPLSYSLEWFRFHLFGMNPVGYHVVNIVLHLLCVALVFLMLKRLVPRMAFGVAAVFALHPCNVESVAWIFQAKTLMSASGGFAAIHFFLRYKESGDRRILAAAVVSFAFGMLSKSSIVMLPFAILALCAWKTPKLRLATVLPSVPFFAVSALVGGVSVWFNLSRSMGGTTVEPRGLVDKVIIAGKCFWFYLYKMVAPWPTLFVYPRWALAGPTVAAVLLLCAIVGLFVLLLAFRKRVTWAPLLGMCFFVLGIFPALGFVDVYFMTFSWVADHYLYFGMVGALVAGGSIGVTVMRPFGRFVGRGVLAVALCMCAALTVESQLRFTSEEAVWRHTLRYNPSAWIAHTNLANILTQRGQEEEGLSHYREALRLNPDRGETVFNTGSTLWQAGRAAEAVPFLQRSIELNFMPSQARLYLAQCLLDLDKDSLALVLLEKVAEKNRRSAEVRYWLAMAYGRNGQAGNALANLDTVTQLDETFTPGQVWYAKGEILWGLRRKADALKAYDFALRYDPQNAAAENNVGVIYADMDSLGAAELHYRLAIGLRPGFAEAHLNLGIILAARGKDAQAAEEFRTALRYNPKLAEADTELGKQRKQAGR